jgi:hypothetical protein
MKLWVDWSRLGTPIPVLGGSLPPLSGDVKGCVAGGVDFAFDVPNRSGGSG